MMMMVMMVVMVVVMVIMMTVMMRLKMQMQMHSRVSLGCAARESATCLDLKKLHWIKIAERHHNGLKTRRS